MPDYSKAPVSELILGITWKTGWLQGSRLLQFLAGLAAEYPELEEREPLASEFFRQDMVITEFRSHQAGRTLYRLRCSKDDEPSWLIQVQANKLYLNWIRPDEARVGQYPGFNPIFERFESLLEHLRDLSPDPLPEPLSYELVYQDRLNALAEQLEKVSDLAGKARLSIPVFQLAGQTTEATGTVMNWTYPLKDQLGEGAFLALQVANIEINEGQVYRFHYAVKGPACLERADWFSRANQLQVELFEQTFDQKVLETWR